MKRRTFLKICGTLAAANYIGPVGKVLGQGDLAGSLDKKLVVIELQGGNDGLNTVVPYSDSSYYDARANIAVSRDSVIQLSESFGLHPELLPLKGLWDDGMVSIVLGVGYPEPDLSHFRSTDIWEGATTDEVIYTGWVGRYTDILSTNGNTGETAFPLGLEIRNSASLMMKGEGQSTISLTDPELFLDTANGLDEVPELEANDFQSGLEMRFIRGLKEETLASVAAIGDAWNSGQNSAKYPEGGLGEDLASIARLIKGELGTVVYGVSLSGFDTHVSQLATHPGLLKELGAGIKAFFDDLSQSPFGKGKDVVVMTTSEFGRRVKDNGSGTDHGTASVHFVVGKNVLGGFYGKQPSLTDLDASGNLKFTTDFRQVFASVLKGHLGCTEAECQQVLKGQFAALPIFG